MKTLSIFLGGIFMLGLAANADNSRDQYPAHWWKVVPLEEQHSWEIPPQAAGPGEVILSKRNELGMLSNFTAAPFELDGVKYASLEGLWQSMKYPEGKKDPRFRSDLKWEFTREQVRNMTAFKAHSAGQLAEVNMEKLGINWVSYQGEQIEYKGKDIPRHYEIIVSASWAKIRQNPKIKAVLLQTGDLILKPDHHQGDDGTIAWRYFDIYMMIREALQQE